MKKLSPTVVLMLSLVATVGAQDLKSSWERIQAFFLSNMHDSVVVHVPEFLEELRRRDLKPQMSVGYFHYAVSLAHLGKDAESDSAFSQAKSLALVAGDNARVAEIAAKQVQLYVGLATRQPSPPPRAVHYYNRALEVLGPSGDLKTKAMLHYQVGILRRSTNDIPGAILDLESSLAAADLLDGEQEVKQAAISALTELYLGAGMNPQAEALAKHSGSSRARIEYTIKLAESAEARGNLVEADRLLSTIQTAILAEGDENRTVEFAKKRYSLHERSGGLIRGYDTLKVLLVQAHAASPSVRFHISRLATMLAIRKGDLEEAVRIVSLMRPLATPSLDPLLNQTEGDIAYLQGDNASAIGSYRRALLSASAFEESERSSIMNNLGLALTRNGEHVSALQMFDDLYARSAAHAIFRIQADLNAGIVLMKTDSTAAALQRFFRARELAKAEKNTALQVMASLRLAESYRRSGLETSAASLFEEVRREQEQLSDPFNRIQVLQALAAQAQTGGDNWSAVSMLRQAYSLAERARATGFIAPIAIDLADNYFLADSLGEASRFYDTALLFYKGTEDLRTQVELRYKKAQCSLGLSNYGEARSEANRAMELLRATGDAEGDLAGLGYATLAFIEFTEGKNRQDIRMLLKAEEHITNAVQIFSASIAGSLLRSEQESQSLRNVNAFRLSVDIAATLYDATSDPRYLELAFNTSEQSRAESFVSDVGTQLVSKLQDPSLRDLAAVTGRLREWGSGETALAVDLTPTSGTRGIKAKPVPDESVARNYERIVQQLSAQNNKASQLVSVNTLTLSSVRELLGENELMLNYYVSLDKIYLFVVSRAGRDMRTISWKPENLASTVEEYRAAIHNLSSDAYLRHARILFDSLLAPVRNQMEGKTLLIVPSGRLNNLPFGGLHDGQQFLVESNSLAVLPNASTLQFVQGGKRLPASPSVLAIGNPANPRVTRLPGSELEVRTIQGIHARSVVYMGQEASETNSRKHMGAFDIVHFACHGLFNYDYPYLSSLALSPDGGNDGFLEVHEIYNLNLTRTGLVILSACETGLAKIRKNDDVIGLVRGFFYAGVPSLAASLWKVDDFATATLMSHYHALLRRGESKSAALQKAQQQLLRSEPTRHPYYWAAFVLYGNGG
ncbi:MAG: CHAT domain-containing protein [Ignavibacteriales bacterium]|nr:CHAT domain-containing protein [Ignavibacteriales bacterium]